MRKRRGILVVGLGFCSAISPVDAPSTQNPRRAIGPPDGAALLKKKGAPSLSPNPPDVPREGPPLVQIIGRQAGKVEGFHYSSGLAQAGFNWDEGRLDAWLTNPQAVIPGAIMAYRQARAETRAAIITYLRGLN